MSPALSLNDGFLEVIWIAGSLLYLSRPRDGTVFVRLYDHIVEVTWMVLTDFQVYGLIQPRIFFCDPPSREPPPLMITSPEATRTNNEV